MRLEKKIMLVVSNKKVLDLIEKTQKDMTNTQNTDPTIKYKVNKVPYSKVIEKLLLEVLKNE